MKYNWKYILAVAAVSVLAAGLLAGCGGGKKAEKTDKPADAGVKKVVKVAHRPDYVPYCFVDKDNKSDGFEVAVLQAVAAELPQYKFEFIPTSDDDLLIGVESGKYDIGVKGAWYTKARKEKFIFPKHYIAASVIGLTFRKEDSDKIKDLESFAKINGKLVPIAPQNAQYAVVQKYNREHPDNQVKLTPSQNFQVSDAYTWVLEGRYDGYFNIELNHINNVEKETGKYYKFRDKLAYVRYQAIPTYALFNKKDQQVADDYDKVWEKLQKSGKLQEMANKYFGFDIFTLVKGDGKEER